MFHCLFGLLSVAGLPREYGGLLPADRVRPRNANMGRARCRAGCRQPVLHLSVNACRPALRLPRLHARQPGDARAADLRHVSLRARQTATLDVPLLVRAAQRCGSAHRRSTQTLNSSAFRSKWKCWATNGLKTTTDLISMACRIYEIVLLGHKRPQMGRGFRSRFGMQSFRDFTY